MISRHEDYFVSHGVLGVKHASKAAAVILEIQPELYDELDLKPSEYVSRLLAKISLAAPAASLNGGLFELVLACVLLRAKLTPFYMEAEVQFVPNAHFDVLVYTKEIGPIVLSAKTSLRERYKQADLESQALRGVHRRSKTYLITLDEREAAGVARKIESGDVIALDSVVVANNSDFDRLISDLSDYTFIKAPEFSAVTRGRYIQ